MKVDFHHHLLAMEGYVGALLDAMDRACIDITCLSGLGLPSDNWLGNLAPDNDDVAAAVAAHPDRFVGFGVIRLGDHGPADVTRLHESGFVGIKTTRPRRPYDDPTFDEVYGEVARLGMPMLFHTGFIVGVESDETDDVSSARCRPVTLDRPARTFPSLTIIMAHLGMPWHDEAAQMCRFHPNVYTDLTGAIEGWRNRKAVSFFRELFYWPDAYQKILFGSDVPANQIQQALKDHDRILIDSPDGVKAAVLGGTAQRLLGLETRSAGPCHRN